MSMFNVSDGYIAYDTKSGWCGVGINWEVVRAATARQAAALTSSFGELDKNDFERVATFLIGMADAEFSKESALINKLFPGYIASKDDLGTFVRNFNEILQGKEVFERATRNLKRAFSERDLIKNGSTEGETRQQLASVISSLYRDKFITVLTQKIYKVVDSNQGAFLEGNLSSIESLLRGAYEDSIYEALQEAINQLSLERDSYFGEHGDYQEVLTALEEFSYLKQDFINLINTRIPFQSIFNQLQKSSKEIYKNKDKKRKVKGKEQRTSGLRSAIDQGIKIQAGQLGGWAYEHVNNATQALALKIVLELTGNTNASVSGMVSSSNIQKIDSSIILSFDPSMTEDVLRGILEVGPGETNNKNLLEAAQKYSDFNDQVLSKLNDGFIIHTSAKAYNMGTNFKGFANDSQRSLSQLPSIISEKQDLAQKLVWAAYNSINGAVLNSSQEVIKNNIKLLLVEYMGRLFFDDWTAIGTSMTADAGNSIHVFALNGIQVPLSVMLYSTGQAIKETASHITDYFRVNISLPAEVDFPGDAKERAEKYLQTFGGRHLTADIIKQAWEQQRDSVTSKSTFSTHFLANFENFLNGLGI